MKNYIAVSFVVVFSIMLTLAACSKGPAGPAGSNGSAGSSYVPPAPLCASPSQKGVTTLLSASSADAGVIYSQSVTLVSGTQGVSLSFYVNQSPVTGQVRLGVYADTSNYPGQLVAEADPVFLTANGWTTAVIPNIYLPTGTYWLACQFSNTTASLAVASGGDFVFTTSSIGWGVLPVTFPTAGTSHSAWRMSCFMSVCP